MPELSQIAESLKSFGGNPQNASPLVSVLGFQPVTSPVDLLSGPVTPLSAFFKSRIDGFGVLGLYRVGISRPTRAASVGLRSRPEVM